jgi:hypothetical protein
MSGMLRWSAEQLQKYLERRGAPAPKPEQKPPAPKPRKYRNEPVEEDGIRFDSKKERDRYRELMVRARAGEITTPNRQMRFAIVVAGLHICDYVADFAYHERDALTGARGLYVVEDVKSEITRKQPVYRLKHRLMQAVHRIEIREV